MIKSKMYISFPPQIGDLLGTSLLAMAFLALEEIGIFLHFLTSFVIPAPIRRHESGQLRRTPPQLNPLQRLHGGGELLPFTL